MIAGGSARMEGLKLALSCIIAFDKGKTAKRLTKKIDYDFSKLRDSIKTMQTLP